MLASRFALPATSTADDDGIGLVGPSAGRWRSRLNINIGYSF